MADGDSDGDYYVRIVKIVKILTVKPKPTVVKNGEW